MNTDMSRRQFVGLAGSLATVLGLGLVGCGGGAGPGAVSGAAGASASSVVAGRPAGSQRCFACLRRVRVGDVCCLLIRKHRTRQTFQVGLARLERRRLPAVIPGAAGGGGQSGGISGPTPPQPLFCPGQERGGGGSLPAGGEHCVRTMDLWRSGSAWGDPVCPLGNGPNGRKRSRKRW